MAKIFEFVNDFLDPRKTELRCKVLRNHDEALKNLVTDDARAALGTMTLEEIVPELLQELIASDRKKLIPLTASIVALLTNRNVGELYTVVENLRIKHDEVHECSGGRFQPFLAGSAAYTADKTHIFGLSSHEFTKDEQKDLVVRGNGYDHATPPWVRFISTGGTTIKKETAGSPRCDVDLNEYLTVTAVALPELGEWRVHGANSQNAAEEDWSKDCGSRNLIIVRAP